MTPREAAAVTLPQSLIEAVERLTPCEIEWDRAVAGVTCATADPSEPICTACRLRPAILALLRAERERLLEEVCAVLSVQVIGTQQGSIVGLRNYFGLKP